MDYFIINMSIKAIATIALAAGLAAAKPINTPAKRQIGFNSVVNGFNGNDGAFNFIDGFNNFNQQQQVIQIQQENLQIIDNGRQQAVVQQVEQVLIVDQVNNGFNNDLNNLFRKSNFQNQFRDVATVTLVVQEIQIAIDDGRGNQVQQNIFAQSAVVANRGARETQTVMVFDSRTLIAQDILGGDAFGKLGGFGGIAGATGALDGAMPTKTAGIQLFGAKPTWSAVAEDPAATLGAIWQGALQDLQDAQNDEADNKLNAQIAAEELKALLEGQDGQDDNKDGEDNADDKAAEEEAKKAEEEAKKQEEEQKKAEEEAAKADAEEAKKQEEEQKKADEAAKQEAEQEKKAEEEAAKKEAEDAKKAEEEAAKKDAEEQKKADEEAKAQAEADKKAEEEAKKAEEAKAAEEKKAE
ncbi:uncharacterized protein J4E78_008501 [Alternaria triticimaculans]|uniref:uncharacterized protein n=1 Tax=Alternaria triticimaculans TaxID=297637 RepID=UPI0020C262D8|nr:uncharacterized protein J4E78_008501 [Alternaria triticimaculans]KAI4648984.1 hypothetical protein J4E78_008501 [Alternaria triticimaculans]